MQEFKSPVTRLARLFKKGRDNWKEKAVEKQALVRSLEIKAGRTHLNFVLLKTLTN
jgi:hypothetical protein